MEPISTAKRNRIMKESIILFIIFLILVIPLYFIVYKFSSAYISNNEANIPIKGSGSDFGTILYNDWFEELGIEEDIFISYEPTTIAQSLKHLHNETLNYSFAGGEVTSNNETLLSTMGIYEIPTVGASVVIIFNLPPNIIGNYRLNFTMDMILQVYNGSLVYWDDVRIAMANFDIFPPFPHERIIPLHYTSANGATLIFTSTLANFSSTWKDVGEEILWPISITQTITKSSDMMLVSSATPYSIGYTLYPYYLEFDTDPENKNSSVNIISLSTQYSPIIAPYFCENSIIFDYNLTAIAFENVTFNSNNVAVFPPINFTCSYCWPFNGFTYLYINSTYYYPSGCSLLLDDFRVLLDWIYTSEFASLSSTLAGYILLQSQLSPTLLPLFDSIECINEIQSSVPIVLSAVLVLAIIFTLILIGRVTYIVYKKEDEEEIMSINGDRGRPYPIENSPLLQKAKIGNDELIIEEQIGSGSFGEVYGGLWRGTRVAIKRMLFNINNPDHTELLEDFKQEAYIMSTLRHPNIVQFLGASMQPPHLLIVTELAERGSLFDVIKNRSIKLSFNRKIGFCIDAAKGMVYLHNCKPPIIHRDLKTANLLVDKHWRVKVTDFGLSRVVDNQKTMTHCGTVDFCAPEVLNRNRYSVKADSYSFTLCVWQIFTRQMLFPNMPLYQMMSSIVKEHLRPPTDKIDIPELVELLKRGWDPLPEKRPTMEEFLEELTNLKEKYSHVSSSDSDEV